MDVEIYIFFQLNNARSVLYATQLLHFKSKHLVTVKAPRQNQLKPVQNVKPRLRIAPLLSMVTSDLTDRNQSLFYHSPFPQSTFASNSK